MDEESKFNMQGLSLRIIHTPVLSYNFILFFVGVLCFSLVYVSKMVLCFSLVYVSKMNVLSLRAFKENQL